MKELRFFPAASKQEWIAALEAHHALAESRAFHHQRVDFVLLPRNASAALADEDAIRLVRRELQDVGIHQRIVDDGVASFGATRARAK